ncbi:hypothetical protein SBADM41S_09154 [Streptomyces badius]
MYSQATQLVTGFFDSRITASTTPRITPSTIARTLISRVRPAPATTLLSNSLSPTACHWMLPWEKA